MSGCTSSENPLDVPPGNVVDPAPYVGTWDIVEIYGGPTIGAATLDVQVSGPDLTLTFTEDGNATVRTAQLTNLSADVIASVQHPLGGWDIVKLTLQNGGNRLVVAGLDPSVVKQDILASTVAGSIVPFDDDDDLISIEATGPDLRTYLTSATTVFVDDAVIFDRAP